MTLLQQDQRTNNSGSLWRRWDPHVHLPGTLRNDGFGDMSVADALEILASRSPAIEVVGVTDYGTTASFREAQQAHDAGAGASIGLLFPNVELRMAYATNRGAAVNLHLLCAPEHVDELDRFLTRLEFTYQDRTYRVEPAEFILLGRAVRSDDSLDERAALAEGSLQFKVELEQLRKVFGLDGWAKEHLLVAVAGGEYDGTSGLRTPDNAFTALRRNIERIAHIIFSANPKQTEYWSGKRTDGEDVLTLRYGGMKVCLHGSDAHNPGQLGVPDGDRFCWLKGDASLETLRMACLSPETRAYVGEADPMDGYRAGRISAVRVPNQNWFPKDGLEMNPGLVAIIGPRGSGKTALADVIAAGAGSDEPFSNQQSFLSRAGRLLRGSVSEVDWTQGGSTSRDLSDADGTDTVQPSGVRYLSQQFVERLCAADGVSDNLLVEIERVVFDSLELGQRQGATDFRELLDIRLQGSRGRQADELQAIAVLGDRIAGERIVERSRPQKESVLAGDNVSLARLEQQIRELTGAGKKGSADRLDVVTDALERRVAELEAVERRHTELRSLQGRVETMRTGALARAFDDLKSAHPRVGLSAGDWEAFRLMFNGDVDGILANALRKAAVERNAVGGTPPDAGSPSLDDVAPDVLGTKPVAVLRAEQERLHNLVGLDRQRAASLQKLNRNASDLRGKIAKLAAEIEHARGAKTRAANYVEQRLSHYAAYFDALLEEASELGELYRPLEDVLSAAGSSAAKLRLSVRRRVDVARWAKQGEEQNFDLRVSGHFKGVGSLARVATDELVPAWEAGTGSEAAQAIRDFSAKYSKEFREAGKAKANDPDEYREWERNVSRWLYGADHISLSYTLMYDKLSIERLSPGLRGIVLLLLYLAVDRSESDPLIIDQPEENLDPESIYTELVQLFRNASRRRQIIMVTHNANLVVNTDVDQVIAADCDNFEEGKLPQLKYLAGGLEDPAVRRTVCEVLEGGAEAFRQRARRLRLSI